MEIIYIKTKKGKMMNDNPEYRIQKMISEYLDNLGVLWTASSNGMKLPISVAAKLKRMGYKKGCPDIYIFEPNQDYRGMMIEVKSPVGLPTKEQVNWHEKLTKRGYYAVIMPKTNSEIESFLWIKKEINEYLGV
jgi:hypothetical protein